MQIIFEKETQHGTYRDALYFPEDQVPSDEEIERLKQERVDNWITFVNALVSAAAEAEAEVAKEVA